MNDIDPAWRDFHYKVLKYYINQHCLYNRRYGIEDEDTTEKILYGVDKDGKLNSVGVAYNAIRRFYENTHNLN